MNKPTMILLVILGVTVFVLVSYAFKVPDYRPIVEGGVLVMKQHLIYIDCAGLERFALQNCDADECYFITVVQEDGSQVHYEPEDFCLEVGGKS